MPETYNARIRVKNPSGDRREKDLRRVTDERHEADGGAGQVRRIQVNKIERSCIDRRETENCPGNDQHGKGHTDRARGVETVGNKTRNDSRDGPDPAAPGGKRGTADLVHAEHLHRVKRVIVEPLVTTVRADDDGCVRPDDGPLQHQRHAP